ncbi:glucoamylase [Ktedonobacter sp. SOSP1-85]|uniref:glycoside hydrolase family 15 protein n=1 Tax=Ktedonobacter sp. SOSP1-85 TaxID=2778367 RepID=UPI001916B98E|nr:glycoside hydrolase family 15 protein [Ktedonobacter sp. SOSP1-85]GHO78771.1 glucoamylase [Ktedonobacter sp. SOSP1-85]
MTQPDHRYHPINSYGVIGDCHSAALVAPDGSIDWGCFPDFDSPAVFCRLLDAEQGGYFQIAPTDRKREGKQRYLPNSNVLQTTFTGKQGRVMLTDFMPVEDLSAWSYRTLNNNTWLHENGSCHSLVRIISCQDGHMELTMRFKATPNYAISPATVQLIEEKSGVICTSHEQHVGLAILGIHDIHAFSMHMEHGPQARHATIIAHFTLYEGERLTFALGVGRSQRAVHRLVSWDLLQRNFDWELSHTLSCWRKWIAACEYGGPYAEWVKRSALTLKMLCYAPTGALVASPTTSLPEEIGGVRNWDYRYTWLRDSSFTLYALNMLGFTEETRAFTRWLLHLSYTDGEDLQIMYGIRGERELPEKLLTHLSGYRGSQPVRVGNAAVKQKQLDVFGEVLDCICLYWSTGNYERYGEQPNGSLWQLLSILVEYVCQHWQDTDNGIWEVRGDPTHFVHSKVMCWVALDRGIRMAQRYHLAADLERWKKVRQNIHEDIMVHGYNPVLQSFTQRYSDTALDASNLIMPLVGFIAPDDPRMVSTVQRTLERLTDQQGFAYRYRNEDGLNGDEGTFTMCTFWLIENLALQGRVEEARQLFERVLACAGPLGLFSEEVSPVNKLSLGNYPQALTHIALINSATTLHRAEQRRKDDKSA